VSACATIPTQFAPAERVPIELVRRQAAQFGVASLTSSLLNSLTDYVLVLNPQRQVVFATCNVAELTRGKTLDELIGRRPGEILDCAHAAEAAGGCGTAEFCSQCGLLKAVLAALEGRRDRQECRVLRVAENRVDALDLLVVTSPLEVGSERFCLFSARDVSDQKRRRVYERVFFHDLINTAGSLEGLMAMLEREAPVSLRRDLELAKLGFHDLLDQIRAQKDLVAAETAELEVNVGPLRTLELVRHAADLSRQHPSGADLPQVRLAPECADAAFESDQTLLVRVLSNLIKNAVEASSPGETVTLGCRERDGRVEFWVHNPGVMPPQVQLQIFKRSYSTKGAGRGLGTYSVRLLSENYLRGRVSFTSAPEQGTTFTLSLPSDPTGRFRSTDSSS